MTASRSSNKRRQLPRNIARIPRAAIRTPCGTTGSPWFSQGLVSISDRRFSSPMTPAALTCDVSRYTITNIQLPFDRSVVRSTALVLTSFGRHSDLVRNNRVRVTQCPTVRVGNRESGIGNQKSGPTIGSAPFDAPCVSSDDMHIARPQCVFSDIDEFAAYVIG